MQKTSIVVGVLLLVACSASPDETRFAGKQSEVNSKVDNSGAKNPTSGSNDTSSQAPKEDSNNAGTATNTEAPGKTDCSTTQGVNECWFCCEDNVPAVVAAEKKIDADWKTCACQASACGSTCANDFCNAADPDAIPADPTCEECLSGTKVRACDTAADTAFSKLQADPIYAPAATCANDNACDSKPSDD